MIAAVVLAAGASQRLGRPKQLVILGGETLLHRAVNTAVKAAFHPVIVVVNNAELIEPLQAIGARVLVNNRHSEGMATSIHAAVQLASSIKASGLVIMACDQPTVTPEHLIKLIAEPHTASGSGYAERIGIPAYFPAAMFSELMELEGDTGARKLLRNARRVAAEALCLDIDTEEDLQRAQELFG